MGVSHSGSTAPRRETAILELKRYFRRMWIIDDEMENEAVEELRALQGRPKVRDNVLNFVKHQKFPWD